MTTRFTLMLLFLLSGLAQLSAQYQTISGGNGDFDDASNWAALGVPPDPLPAGSSVTISHAITLNINFDVDGAFRIVPGGSLTGSKNLKINGSGTNNGTMSIKKLQIGPNEGSGMFTNNGTIILSGELHVDATLVNTGEITANKVKVHGGTFSGGGSIYSGNIEFDDNQGRPGSVSDMKFCSSDGGSTVPSFTYKDGTGHTVNAEDTYVCDGAGAPNNYRLITSADLATGIALPVELLAFTATSMTKGVGLDWSTATESSNKQFEVQYSTDGKTFKQIGIVAGAGTSYTTQRYRFVHSAPAKGVNYYRLKQVDYDGAFEYSNMVTVELNTKTKGTYRLFPNPVRERFTIQTAAGDPPTEVTLINTLGQEIQLFNPTAGEAFDLPGSLHKGTYIVRFDWAGETHFERIVVQ